MAGDPRTALLDAEVDEGSPELSRDLGLFAVFATATGTMIGAGIFVLPGLAAETAGPGAALSFLVAGIIAGVAAVSVCELATAMPKAGGPYFFVSRAMGPLFGTIIGLGGWISLVLKGAFALRGLGQYLMYFSPIPIVATAVGGGLLLTGVNYLGAKASGVLQNVIVIGLLTILAAFVVAGLAAVDEQTLRPLLPFGWEGVFTATGIVFISYLGILKAAALAEEVERPGRNIPLGILSSVVLVTILYVLTMVIVNGVLSMDELRASTAPLSDAGLVFLGVWGGVIVAIAGILATLSTSNAAVLSSPRYLFAMSRDGLMTPWISKIHPRFRTPSRSILVTGGTMLVLVVVLDVEGLAKLGAVFGVVSFALVNLSVVFLRLTSPDWYRPSFRAPFVPVLPLLGAAAALALIPGLGTLPQGAALGFFALGVGWFLWHRTQAERAGKPIQPEYGFRDKLVEVQQVLALKEKRKAFEEEVVPERTHPAVVVEFEAGKPNKHLLALAAAIAQRHEGYVDGITVTEIPLQSPLTGPTTPPPSDWLRKIRARMRYYGVEFHFHHLLARSRAHAILSFADPEVRTVLLDWRDEFREHKLRGSYLDSVLRGSPARVAVLKYRGHKKYERILVATAGSPYATAEVELADAVATLTGASITFMMVLPPDHSPGREDQAREYLAQLQELTENDAELHIEKNESVPEAILEVGRDHDLIVLGATRRVGLRQLLGRHIVGEIADKIAERAEGSVLITKDPAPSRRMSIRVARWWGRLKGRFSGDDAQPPPGPPSRQIEPFPRKGPRS